MWAQWMHLLVCLQSYTWLHPTHTQAETTAAAGAETKRQLLTGRKCVLQKHTWKNLLNYNFLLALLLALGNESPLNQTWSCISFLVSLCQAACENGCKFRWIKGRHMCMKWEEKWQWAGNNKQRGTGKKISVIRNTVCCSLGRELGTDTRRMSYWFIESCS